MIKKLLILIVSLLPTVANAQTAVGSWKVYPAFGEVSKMIETPHIVYLASEGNLHSYDKENDETRSYEPGTDISGGQVKDIYYNYDGRYLVVSYEDANLDIIYDDGRRVNLPDIRDANVNVLKSVNDVAFDDNRIYVATSFGLVVYDAAAAEVRESGVYGINISSVAVMPSHVLVTPTEKVYASQVRLFPKGSRINNIENSKYIGNVWDWSKGLYAIPGSGGTDGKLYFAEVGYGDRLYIMEVNADGSGTVEMKGPFYDNVSSVIPGDDALYVVADGAIHSIVAPGERRQLAAVPSVLSGNGFATRSGQSSIWAADVKGLGNYRIGEDGSLTVLRDKYRPDWATTFSKICRIYPSTDGRGFFVCNMGMSANYPIEDGDLYSEVFSGNFVENGLVRNIEVSGMVTIKTDGIKRVASEYGNRIFMPTFVLEDPDDYDKYYIGSGMEGVYVIKDGKEIGKFDENSNIHKNENWGWRVNCAQFDEAGNLLVGVYTGDASKPAIVVLPAAKRKKNPKEIVKEDWIGLDMGGLINNRDLEFIICKKSPMIYICDTSYQLGFAALHTGGTITNPSDDKSVVVNNMIDQDGKSFLPNNIFCFVEDLRGRVWVGTTNGPIEITNPLSVFSPDFRINRLKVPRNDGTNLADYLLETEEIRCMAVDASNRKWIGTKESGIYLVSENGDEILENFNMSNSPLGSNNITDIYVDPNNNSVFVTTMTGLYEYSSTSAPARPDYSNVYAYPNPVEPGYTGWITITGLMDSSLVKIMDSGMHLVYQTTSEGGMAMWDGCTLNGARVKSGVYYVVASTSDEMQSEGDVVAKILVVN